MRSWLGRSHRLRERGLPFFCKLLPRFGWLDDKCTGCVTSLINEHGQLLLYRQEPKFRSPRFGDESGHSSVWRCWCFVFQHFVHRTLRVRRPRWQHCVREYHFFLLSKLNPNVDDPCRRSGSAIDGGIWRRRRWQPRRQSSARRWGRRRRSELCVHWEYNHANRSGWWRRRSWRRSATLQDGRRSRRRTNWLSRRGGRRIQ